MATIGELTNVPEPGAGVQSPWAQDTTNRIHHRFANKAALDLWTTALPGTLATTLDDSREYRKFAGGWSSRGAATYGKAGEQNTNAGSGQTIGLLVNFVIPADFAQRLAQINYTCLAGITGAGNWQANLQLDGANLISVQGGGLTVVSIIMHRVAILTAGAAHTITASVLTAAGQTWNTYADPNFHVCDVLAVPV